MTNNERIESRISLLVKHNSAAEKETQQLLSSVAKSKTDVEVVLICDATEQSKIETANAELIQKNKLQFVAKSAFKNYTEKAQGRVFVFVEDVKKLNLNAALSWVNSNKKVLAEDAVVVPSRLLDKKTKAGWLLKIYNFCYRFFTPSKLTDNEYGLLIARTTFLERVLAEKNIETTSFKQMLLQLQSNEIAVKEVPLTAADKVSEPGIGSILSTPAEYFTYLFNWFVLSPINQIKQNKVDFSSSQSAIYRLLFFASALFMLYFMPAKSFDYGLTWDSKLHNDYGYQMLKYFDTDGQDTTCFTSHRDYPFYGEHINVISAWVNQNIQPEWGEFETRHFINALYGFFALLFCGLIGRELFGWRTGLMALWFAFLTPTFFAHGMNNPTDFPLATGFAIGLYGILLILKQLPKVKANSIFVFALGLGVAIGSRIVGVLLVPYLGLFMGVVWLMQIKKEGFAKASKLILPYAIVLIAAAVLGYILGLSLWPYGQHRPIANPLEALTKSSANAFYAYNLELWEGEKTYMVYAKWYYVVKFIAITLPLFVLLGIGAGIVGVFKLLNTNKNVVLACVLFTVLFPLVYAEVKDITHYNGWRHYLFIYPGLVALSGLGWEFLFGVSKQKWLRFSLLGLMVLLMSKTTFWMIKNHPNETVYYNEIVGGTAGAYGNYEMDYYANSCREAGEWIANNEPKGKKLLIVTNNEPLTVSYWAKKINNNIEVGWTRDYEEEKQFWDYQIITTRTYSKTQLNNGSYPPKGTVYQVMADGVPIACVVKREVWYMPLGYKAVEAKNMDSAVYYFEKAAAWDPKSEEVQRMYGYALMMANRTDEANKQFDKAIALYPENYSAYTNKGLLYFNKKDYNKCIEFCKQSIKYRENSIEAYYYAALAYLNMNDYTNAIKILEGGILFNNGVPEMYFYLAQAYMATGNYNKAVTNYELALTLNKKMGPAWQGLAETYSKMGKTQEANFCMQKFQELGGQ